MDWDLIVRCAWPLAAVVVAHIVSEAATDCVHRWTEYLKGEQTRCLQFEAERLGLNKSKTGDGDRAARH